MKTIRSLTVIAALTMPVFLSMPAHATGAFKNCDAAYTAGYSNIPSSDSHYAPHLDRDKDGIACDKPPAGFVPHGDDENQESTTTEASDDKDKADAAGQTKAKDEDLAETGGSSATPYIAGAGAVLLAGGGCLAMRRRRHN